MIDIRLEIARRATELFQSERINISTAIQKACDEFEKGAEYDR